MIDGLDDKNVEMLAVEKLDLIKTFNHSKFTHSKLTHSKFSTV